MGGEVSTDFKSSNRIEISWLVQVLLNFDWFWRSHPLGDGWVGRRGLGVVTGSPHTCAHACICTHMHVPVHTYDIIGNPRDFPKSNGGGHLHGIIMFTMHAHACVCVHACMCMCTCVGGTPQPPPTPIHPALPTPPPPPSTQPPQPKSPREPKTPKFNKSWTNQDNSILLEDSLPLNIPELI